MFASGLGAGLFIAPNTQFIIATVHRVDAGSAAGVVTTAQRIGTAIGVAVVSSVLFGTVASRLALDPSAPEGSVVILGTADFEAAYATAAAHATAVSAGLSLLAFTLVFVLPKRVDAH
jgi:hypothetical protein